MASASEKAGALRSSAGGKAETFMASASEKAGALKNLAGEKAGAFLDFAGEKAGALKEAAKTNLALVNEKRSLEKNYQALGEWYAAQCGEEVPEAVADIVKAVRDSQTKIAELRERLAKEPADAAAETPEEESEEK